MDNDNDSFSFSYKDGTFDSKGKQLQSPWAFPKGLLRSDLGK